jgi:lyso-ornithine lipid O-acyltransferase
MSLHRAWRAAALGVALGLCIVRFWFVRLRGPLSLERRALWLQWSARSVLAAMGIRSSIAGGPPRTGLVVSNHLSYLDIIVFSAAMPCCFVAKREVEDWPYFGRAARAAGTIFLDRSNSGSANRAAEEIGGRLPGAVPILLFPEGTSSDGTRLLPFHPRLIQPAVLAAAPVTAAAIRYLPPPGGEERQFCWYGEESFLPHLWKVLGASGFSVHIDFGQPRLYTDARLAARQTQAIIGLMRQQDCF